MNNNKETIHFENLDGLRAIAAFSVIFFHITLWFSYPKTNFYDSLKFSLSFGGNGGAFGVAFFFILSGFLITYLMFAEETKYQSLNVKFFYVRRLLRIWPLYYFTVFVGFSVCFLIPVFTGHSYAESASFLSYCLFATNFDHIYNGNPSTGILGVQWSVAVEEQFYLIWPIVFYLFSKRRYFPFLIVVIIICSEVFFQKAESYSVKYFHLFSNFRLLAFGALLAYLCYFKRDSVVSFLQKINKVGFFAIYAICLFLIFFKESSTLNYYLYRYTYRFLPENVTYYLYSILPFLFFGFVIVEQNFANSSFFKIGSVRILTWLGKISYGLYLTHMIAIYIILSVFSETSDYIWLKIFFTLLITIGISYLSYTYFESYFLSFKKKFSLIQTTDNQTSKIQITDDQPSKELETKAGQVNLE